jgi:4-amino-4-deoxy-L-arabinose transferase-like glycosyltransferase
LSTITPRAPQPARSAPPSDLRADAGGAPSALVERLCLLAILVLSGLLEFVKLTQNGYANVYYAAAVKSMLRSWHNFFFVSADPNGLITVDKPPLALWLQAVSAKLFGFAALSLIVPEGLCAVLAVFLLYRIVAPRFGVWAGLAGALALAVFPSFVAVSRENGVDSLLILLMLAAAGLGLAAIDSGRLRTLVWCGVAVGLAFNTKSLAAGLVVPGIVAGYLVCAPGSWRRRLGHLAVAGAVSLTVALSWSLAVDLTPALQRPFIGSTSGNSELQLEFGYNGFGRVGGQQGGPGTTTKPLTPAQTRPLIRPGVNVALTASDRRYLATHRPAVVHRTRTPRTKGRRRAVSPTPFGGARSPLRIFGSGLGGQAGWLVPLALIGMLGLGLLLRGRRGDRRLAGLLVLGGWFLVELVTLDFSAGIVHPYYASALGPGAAAMAGAGAAAIGSLLLRPQARRALRGYVLAVLAIACTLVVQLVLIQREGDPLWWRVPLVVLCLGAVVAMATVRRRAGWALAVAVGALMVAPLVYSFSVWLAPVSGTFPAAGPYSYAGHGGYGLTPTGRAAFVHLARFLHSEGETSPYAILTESDDQASPLILMGLSASSEGGYNTTDPALSGDQLATLVAKHEARYLLVSGIYSNRGGNGASTAARLVCPEVPTSVWAGGITSTGNYLVDCRGKAAELRHPIATAREFLRTHPKVHYAL